jgi:hypothetical protein
VLSRLNKIAASTVSCAVQGPSIYGVDGFYGTMLWVTLHLRANSKKITYGQVNAPQQTSTNQVRAHQRVTSFCRIYSVGLVLLHCYTIGVILYWKPSLACPDCSYITGMLQEPPLGPSRFWSEPFQLFVKINRTIQTSHTYQHPSFKISTQGSKESFIRRIFCSDKAFDEVRAPPAISSTGAGGSEGRVDRQWRIATRCTQPRSGHSPADLRPARVSWFARVVYLVLFIAFVLSRLTWII